MQSNILTHEANEAFTWMIERMPDAIFVHFKAEMDEAIRQTAARFGFDNELLNAFKVTEVVPAREPLSPADDTLQHLQAHVYDTGEKKYAVIGSGKIFHQTSAATWRPSRLTLEEVKLRAITRVTDTIKVKAKYL
ncbi:hypothetical protein E3L83_19505 [Salmonella enterica]|nr:hypothetical protein [Salmonella enterica]